MLVTRFAPSPPGAPSRPCLVRLAGLAARPKRPERKRGRALPAPHRGYRRRALPAGFEAAIFDDLWLGLDWERPVLRQSEHFARYRAALAQIRDAGLAYPCFCTRADIRREIEAAASAPHGAPHGPPPGLAHRAIRPPDNWAIRGAARAIPAPAAASRRPKRRPVARGDPHAWRLDTAAAAARFPGLLARRGGRRDPRRSGALRRCRARPQGYAGELPSRRHAGRRPPGRHPRGARRRPVRRHPYPPAAPGRPRPAGAALPPSSAPARRRRHSPSATAP